MYFRRNALDPMLLRYLFGAEPKIRRFVSDLKRIWRYHRAMPCKYQNDPDLRQLIQSFHRPCSNIPCDRNVSRQARYQELRQNGRFLSAVRPWMLQAKQRISGLIYTVTKYRGSGKGGWGWSLSDPRSPLRIPRRSSPITEDNYTT